jgi:hypothetical protein
MNRKRHLDERSLCIRADFQSSSEFSGSFAHAHKAHTLMGTVLLDMPENFGRDAAAKVSDPQLGFAPISLDLNLHGTSPITTFAGYTRRSA